MYEAPSPAHFGRMVVRNPKEGNQPAMKKTKAKPQLINASNGIVENSMSDTYIKHNVEDAKAEA